eukprot:6100201-Amphidinium_carterae.1
MGQRHSRSRSSCGAETSGGPQNAQRIGLFNPKTPNQKRYPNTQPFVPCEQIWATSHWATSMIGELQLPSNGFCNSG